jgi:hypothetical protein
MQEIRTSGSMSGDGKRSVAAWPKLPRPSSTLPSRRFAAAQQSLGFTVGFGVVRTLADAPNRPFPTRMTHSGPQPGRNPAPQRAVTCSRSRCE